MASKTNMVPIFVELIVQLGRETLTTQKYKSKLGLCYVGKFRNDTLDYSKGNCCSLVC